MESTIKDVSITHLFDNNLFCNYQFGFVSGCSVQLKSRFCLIIGLTSVMTVTQLMSFILISRKLFIQLKQGSSYINEIHADFVIIFWACISHFSLADIEEPVSMLLYLYGIMSPVADLKEAFLDLSPFSCISMTYQTVWPQMYICLPATQKSTTL